MSEVSDYLAASGAMAKTANVAALDDDPEQAARSLELEEASGVPATAIFGDVDTFERQHKAAIGSSIIADNVHIADYLNSHPMAPRLSHDDLGQLDTASQAITNTGGESRLAKWLKDDSISQSFMKGFGDQPIDTRRFYQGFVSQHDIDWALHTTRLQAATAGAASQVVGLGEIGMEGLSRVTSGLLHMGFDGMSAIFGESAARDLTAVAEMAMTRGDIGVKALGGGAEGPMRVGQAATKVFRDLSNSLKIADHYTAAKMEPPPNVDPLIDTAKAEQAKNDAKALKDALSESTKSATRDRSPDYYSNFVRQHVGDREIGIDAEAVRALYGDKLPEVGDNILGWVPDLAGKLAAAEGIGGDIRVPLADYLARVDPDVAKELHDHLRLRDGGLTIEETRGLQSKEVIADPLQLVRGSGGLEPQFSLGDRKVTLQRMGEQETKGPFGKEAGFHDFDLLDETGKKIGFMNLSEAKGGKQIYVEMIQAGKTEKMYDPNFLGPGIIRDLKRQIKAEFPQAETITGHRVSGAREKAGVEMTAAMPVIKLSQEAPEGWGHVDAGPTLRELFAEIGGQTIDQKHSAFHYGPKLEPHKVKLDAAIREELARITPKQAQVFTPDQISAVPEKPGMARRGFHQQFREQDPWIVVALDNPNAMGVARHEAVHHLRQQGFFVEREWSTLERASRQNDWSTISDVETRYKDLHEEGKLEESIADAYMRWKDAKNKDLYPPGIARVFQRLEEFFEALRTRVKEITGKDLSWDEIFQKVDTGEIGGREGNAPLKEGAFRQAMMDDSKSPKAANDIDAISGRDRPSYSGAVNKQRIERFVDKDTKTGDFEYWQKIAEKENHIMMKSPNAYAAARAHSLDGKTTMIIDGEGRRVVYKDGVKVARELHRDMPGFEPQAMDEPIEGIFEKAKAMGVTQAHMDRMLNLIAKRNAEDLTKATARAEKQQKRSQTAEWKQRRTDLRDEVREQLASRPDLATDELFAKGGIKLHPDFLSEEQKASLPKDYIQKKNGVNPDDLAPYFGYTSGDALVERLGMLTTDRRSAGMSQRDYFNRLVDVETDRRLNAEFGDLGQSIMDAAKDQALSETQLNLIHEETMAYAMAAKQTPKFTKEEFREQVKQRFDITPVGQIKSDLLIQTAGKLSRKIEEAASKGDWAEAYRLSQPRERTVIAAKMARDYERQQAQLDRTAKTFRNREVGSVEQPFTNWVHDLLSRAGFGKAKFLQGDLIDRIGRQPQDNLKDFVAAKEAEWMGNRTLPIADTFTDPAFQTKLKDLPYADFKEFKNAIDLLVKAGRDEKKIYSEGGAADRAQTIAEMRTKLKTFPQQLLPDERNWLQEKAQQPKKFVAGLTAMPTLLRRWERLDPRGIFSRYITYPMREADNTHSTLQREVSRALKEVGPLKDSEKLVDSPFNDPKTRTEENPDGLPWNGFMRKHVLGMLAHAGNASNWRVLAQGYGADPVALMKWLEAHTTPEDWAQAQKRGDMIFGRLIKKSDGVYERTEGVPVEKIPLEPITNVHGTFEGWYHPLDADPIRKEVWTKDESGQWSRNAVGRRDSVLDKYGKSYATTANGYTKKRSGAVYPLDLDITAMNGTINQMIQDIAYREPLLEIQKIFKNEAFRNEIDNHYGVHYKDLLDPWLQRMAGQASIPSAAWKWAGEWSEYLRQNVISTYIGGNIYTALKHGPTALVMSSRVVGAREFLPQFGKQLVERLAGDPLRKALEVVGADNYAEAVKGLYAQSPKLGLSMSEFAMKHSEALQRRERHWQDTIAGETKELKGESTLREKIIQKGSWLVAQSDMLSAKPTWIAEFNKRQREGLSFGESVNLADDAVTRAHGTTGRTDIPELVAGGGPVHGWLTSVYGFMGTRMQRMIEIGHQLNDIHQLGKEAELKAAAKRVPKLLGDLMTFAVWPIIVEELVVGLGTEDRRTLGQQAASWITLGMSSSVLYMRDFIHGLTSGHEPGVGLLSSAGHDAATAVKDLLKGKEAFSKQHAGKTVADILTLLGEAKGVSPKVVGNATRFGIDLVNKQTHPRSATEVFRGVTRGTTKLRVEK